MRSDVNRWFGLVIVVTALAADQLLKSWAHAVVPVYGNVPLAPGLNLVAINNSGVAFGLAGGAAPWLLIIVGLALSAWLFRWLLRTPSVVHRIGLGLAVGGALGNVADRLQFGSVRDYIDIYWGNHHWPAFNLADAAIVVGLALVVIFNEKAPSSAPAGSTRGRKSV